MGFVEACEGYRQRAQNIFTGGVSGLDYYERLTESGLTYVTTNLTLPKFQEPAEREEMSVLLLRLNEKGGATKGGLPLSSVPWDTLAYILINEPNLILDGWTFADMEPVSDSHNNLFEFFVVRDGKTLELNARFYSATQPYYDGQIAVRVLPG